MNCTYYTKQQVKERLLFLLEELEAKMREAHPQSFFALTYATRRARYLELLGKVEQNEQLSSFVMSRLFHKGARMYADTQS
jgi:hypothetical protein